MPLHYQDDMSGIWVTRCVTWVDDLAVSVCAAADQVVDKAAHMMSIIQDTMLEHGMVLTCGAGKTAAIFAFHGEGALTKARQVFERTSSEGLCIMSEHFTQGLSQDPNCCALQTSWWTHHKNGKLFARDQGADCQHHGQVASLEQVVEKPQLGGGEEASFDQEYWHPSAHLACWNLDGSHAGRIRLHGRLVFSVILHISRSIPETTKGK